MFYEIRNSKHFTPPAPVSPPFSLRYWPLANNSLDSRTDNRLRNVCYEFRCNWLDCDLLSHRFRVVPVRNLIQCSVRWLLDLDKPEGVWDLPQTPKHDCGKRYESHSRMINFSNSVGRIKSSGNQFTDGVKAEILFFAFILLWSAVSIKEWLIWYGVYVM